MSLILKSDPDLETRIDIKYENIFDDYEDPEENIKESANCRQSNIQIANCCKKEESECQQQQYITDETASSRSYFDNEVKMALTNEDLLGNEYSDYYCGENQAAEFHATVTLNRCKYNLTNHNQILIKDNLEFHVGTQHKQKIYACEFCHSEFPRLSDLKTHNNSNHKEIFRCQFCDYMGTHLKHLKKHIMTKHRKDKMFVCSYCDYESIQKANVNRHINNKHTREKLFECQYCEYENTELSNMKRHITNRHKREKINKYEYSDCKSTSVNKQRNVEHAGKTIYQCDHCNYESPQLVNLKRHTNSKHMRKNILYKCGHCNHESARLSNFKSHMIKHMKKILNTTSQHTKAQI